MPFIFISYSHKDSEYANRLADSLEAKGLDVWIDERIDYGETWPRKIRENLDACSAFVVIMTSQAEESRWVQNELTRAQRLGKRIFPLLLEGEVWLALETDQYVDVRGAKLPPARFYTGLAVLLSAGQPSATATTHLRGRLRTELGELQRRYDNLTSRLAAVDTDLGRALDSEQRLVLDDRRTELAGLRDLVSARMAQIERDLAEQEASAQAVRAAEAKAAAISTDAAKVEAKPKPVVQVEPVAAKPAKPVEPALSDLLIIDKPLRLELVRVPAGEFLMGSDPANDKNAIDWEQPQHRLSLPEFYIGKYPVTNEQYAVFVRRTKGTAPKHWQGGKIPSGKEKHPVVNVSWHDARAFCAWVSKSSGGEIRLPNEAEWEKAARGVDGRLYPWGNEAPNAELCNFDGNIIDDTTPVDRYPKGVSPYGALDMAGNVGEWTGSLWGKDAGKPQFGYPYKPTDGREELQTVIDIIRVVRGRSDRYVDGSVRCAYRDWYYSDFHDDVGFRVVCVSPPS